MPILLSDVIKELNISIEQAEICLSEETDLGDVDFGKDYELTDEQYDILKERFGKKEIVEGQIVPCTIKLILNDGIIVALSEQEEGIISERELIMHPELQVDGALNLRTQIIIPNSQNCLWFYVIPSTKFEGQTAEAYARDTALAGKADICHRYRFCRGQKRRGTYHN